MLKLKKFEKDQLYINKIVYINTMRNTLQEYDAKLMPKAGSLIGLDEVGRGALAGPVFTAACLLKERLS